MNCLENELGFFVAKWSKALNQSVCMPYEKKFEFEEMVSLAISIWKCIVKAFRPTRLW